MTTTSGRTTAADEASTSRWGYWFVCPPAYSDLPMVCALRQWLKEEAAAFPSPQDWLDKR